MKKIELNHWFIEDNSLSISLMRFFVKIHLQQVNDNIVFVLQVISDNDNLFLSFDTLEECIDFTENTIINCQSVDEIFSDYRELKHKILTLKR